MIRQDETFQWPFMITPLTEQQIVDRDRRAAVRTEAAARDRAGVRNVATFLDTGGASGGVLSPSPDVIVGTADVPQTGQEVPPVSDPDEMATRPAPPPTREFMGNDGADVDRQSNLDTRARNVPMGTPYADIPLALRMSAMELNVEKPLDGFVQLRDKVE